MIKVIAYDLDDTLLDTTGLLAPRYARSTFELMIKKGLKLSLDECERQRLHLVRSVSHRDTFEKLAHDFGTSETVACLPEIIEHFYNPEIPETLPLMPGARENIDYLKNKYVLYLVTAGSLQSQLAKAKALNVVKDFKDVIVVDSIQKKKKKDAFEAILRAESIQPENMLCIGNSLSSEIKDALELGNIACHFEHGEARGTVENLVRPPHFRIKTHSEFIPTCQL